MTDDGALFEVPPAPPNAGDLERATRTALAAAELDDLDGAGAAALIGGARLLDLELSKGKTYAYAQLLTQWRELLIEYRLTPAARGGQADDPADAFLRALNAAGPGTS